MVNKHIKTSEDFGLRITRSREKKKFARYRLAEEVGVSLSTMQAWEKGEREPPYSSILKLANILDVSIEWLMTGSNSNRTIDSDVTDGSDSKEILLQKQQAIEIDLNKMAEIIKEVEIIIKENAISDISAEKKSKFIIMLYKIYKDKDSIDMDFIRNSIMLVV